MSNDKIIVPKPQKSTLYFTVDNMVLDLLVNDNQIKLPYTNEQLSDWKITKKIDLRLFEGDHIQIKGKNKGYTSGIIGSLHFMDENGKKRLYNTGREWICNDVPPKLVGKNDGTNVGFAKGWTDVPEIERNARWIWDIKSAVYGTETACSFQIPSECTTFECMSSKDHCKLAQ